MKLKDAAGIATVIGIVGIALATVPRTASPVEQDEAPAPRIEVRDTPKPVAPAAVRPVPQQLSEEIPPQSNFELYQAAMKAIYQHEGEAAVLVTCGFLSGDGYRGEIGFWESQRNSPAVLRPGFKLTREELGRAESSVPSPNEVSESIKGKGPLDGNRCDEIARMPFARRAVTMP